MTWYGDSEPPSVMMGSTNLPSPIDWLAQMTLSGTVSQADGNGINLVLVMNNDFGFIWPIGDTIRSGTSFSYSYTPAELGLGAGSHSFDVYAFDERGAVSAPVRFAVEVKAPTVQPTFSPRKSPTATRSFQVNTPNPTLEQGDDGGAGAGAAGAGDPNSGAKVTIGVLLPVAVIALLAVGYLVFCRDRRGFGAVGDTTADLNEVGSYTI
jgi:hypothetical protein